LKIFSRAAPLRVFTGRLIDWNCWIFYDNPLCDDLLTMGVDNPGRGGL